MKTILLLVFFGSTIYLSGQAKYDLKLSFDQIKCVKAVEGPFDTNEEIGGASWVQNYITKTGDRVGPNSRFIDSRFSVLPLHILFSTDNYETTSEPFYRIEQGNFVDLSGDSNPLYIRNLSFDDLFGLRIYIQSSMNDVELLQTHYNYCKQCIDGNTFLIDMRKYRNSMKIARLGQSDNLEFLIDWFENKDTKNASQLKLKYTVTITRTDGKF
ncbi:MAG: hypothetical protein WAS55_08835 [Saprospiraceae bacterium]